MSKPEFHLVTHTKGWGKVDTILLKPSPGGPQTGSNVYETAIFWPNGDSDVVATCYTQEEAERYHGIYSYAVRRHELTQANLHSFDPVF